MRFSIYLIIISIIICQAASLSAFDTSAAERSFLVEEKIRLKNLPDDMDKLRIWIPYPVSDSSQRIDDFKLSSAFDASIIEGDEYGNKVIYLKPKQKITGLSASELTFSFKVDRMEYGTPFDPAASEEEALRFLKPDRLVPVTGEIKRLAEEITRGKEGDLEKVRAIYDYIIDELTYSKDDPKVCGIGDSLLTLEHKKGNCTDYHSLFISLVRSLGIPAKFEIGFKIPEDKSQGRIGGYHCWAKFYLKDKGWIPVDISEADKHPERRDYFFGRIDENKVHMTSGRDINLKYANDSQPLNFFVWPYVEVNGSQFNDVDVEVSFKDLKGAM
ncbi:MAG: transglutaminase domain-containing protein [Candidatus Omnitrophota bacterium]|nr:transglutaminase domain-containing protein [Candidatus Omnitrophota bacterium]